MPLGTFNILPNIPENLEGLAELALDLRFSWSHATDCLWIRIDSELWHKTHNPWLILQSTSASHLEELSADEEFVQEVARQLAVYREAISSESWFARDGSEKSFSSIAFFCMEYGLAEALPIYSGGLGILAGDYLKTASDMGIPTVGIGLLFQQGYFRQIIDPHGEQLEFFPFNNPIQLPVTPVRGPAGEWIQVTIPLPGRDLRLQIWEALVGRVRLYLLDSNSPLNSPVDRGLTSELYGGGPEMRLLQEMILGIGGARLLQVLGLQPEIFHLNEGHAAFAVLERAHQFAASRSCSFETALTATRTGNLFTTHTPVASGFDHFSPELIRHYMAPYAKQIGVAMEELISLGQATKPGDNGSFDMAVLAMRGSGAVNGVSRLHASVSRRIFQPLFPRWPEPEVPIGHVTNGIHVPSWDSIQADTLWTRACGKERWLGDWNQLAKAIRALPDETLWTLRTRARERFVHFVRDIHGEQLAAVGASEEARGESILDPNALTICFARRFATYKRPNLLLADPARLARLLCDRDRPVQLVIAGKAHPADAPGKAMIRQWVRFIHDSRLQSRVVFLSDYDMLMAEQMVQGADAWLNTPRRPWEACGTSGMKVLVNGGLNVSKLDGWWAEAYTPEVGWAIGDAREHDEDPAWDTAEAGELYRLLEEEIVPCFFDRDEHGIPRRWVARVRASMAELTPKYSCNRMLQEYIREYYQPLARSLNDRISDPELAEDINAWKKRLTEHWKDIRFGNITWQQVEDMYHIEVQVYLDELDKEDVRVQLYADANAEHGHECLDMRCEEPLTGAINGYLYRLSFAATRPFADYTPRIIPAHPQAAVPLEASHILWLR